MMLLQQHSHACSMSFSDHGTRPFGGFIGTSNKQRKRVRVAAALRLEDIAEIAHNKVLIAAAGSAAIGQLVKPFAGTLFYGKDFDLKTVVSSGGFPSTHSSAVVAAATSIGLERGFSDSIFGIAVVYAGLVMYDAQGVRREVGIHARTLNNVLPKLITTVHSKSNDELIDSQPKTPSVVAMKSSGSGEESSSFASEPNNIPYLLRPEMETRRTTQAIAASLRTNSVEEVSERVSNWKPLKESVGHTEVEVIAGGLLGFFASMVVYMIM